MDFFKTIIEDTYKTLDSLPQKEYATSEPWKDAGNSQVVLLRDTYTELDGVGYNIVTTEEVNDSIVIIGEDISKLKGKVSFARISVIQIDECDSEQNSYNLIRKIEYTKYHTFPDGYMIRTSSRSHNEAVRISSQSVKNGIDFRQVGSLYINKYKENPAVKAVRVYFVTDKNADYSAFQRIAEKNNRITETLNHVINNVNFDCDVCNLKPICDEVEGIRELHFKNKSM